MIDPVFEATKPKPLAAHTRKLVEFMRERFRPEYCLHSVSYGPDKITAVVCDQRFGRSLI